LIDGQAGAFVTAGSAFMFSRVYVVNGDFDLGDGKNRLVPGEKITLVRYEAGKGLWIHSTNYTSYVPDSSVKATWSLRA
jgi:hypothetical protein